MTEMQEHTLGEGHKSLIFPCECYDTHYLYIEWDGEDTEWRSLSITREWRPERFRDKIKSCFKILRNKEYIQDGILLNDKSVNAIKEFLSDK